MKKMLCIVLATVLFVPYAAAYGVSKLFKIKGNEDMPTIQEWFGY